jgi:hypothetical protein
MGTLLTSLAGNVVGNELGGGGNNPFASLFGGGELHPELQKLLTPDQPKPVETTTSSTNADPTKYYVHPMDAYLSSRANPYGGSY